MVRGFTLVELLVVIVIIAALAGLTAPMVIKQRRKADQTEAVSNARQIGLALFEFETTYGRYPDTSTAEEVKTNTESDLNLSGNTATDYFRQLIAAHQEDMRRVCMAMFGDATVAEDATQAAWLIAWKKIDKVRGPDQLRPWLVSVAVIEAKEVVRKRRRRAEVEVKVDPSDRPGGIDPATRIAAVDLHAALDRLDPDDAALLAMRYLAGFDSPELGLATGKSPAAIRQRLKRLLDRLREDLNDG